MITRGKSLAIFGTKDGKRQVVWSQAPDYEGWNGRLENDCFAVRKRYQKAPSLSPMARLPPTVIHPESDSAKYVVSGFNRGRSLNVT